MDDKTRTEMEAAAFRGLVEHLQKRTDVQNIDLMNLSGFCRNCLAKWYLAAAEERGVEMDYDGAREAVYGMSYGNWKDQGGYKVSGDITDQLYGMQGSFSYTVELNSCGSQGGLQGGFHADPLLIRPTVRMHLLTNMYLLDESPEARIG